MANAVSERKGETTRLGSFEVVRRLTTGGMAEIFLARTRGPSGFEKLVVLKKILPKYAGKQRYVQLFLEEARLAATLDHPNIVHVYDIGMVDGSYFFTMEHLHGQDVRSILHRAWRTGDKLPIEDAVQVARHVASALHFAHDKPRDDGSRLGIVHRDVSPSNVIVTYDGATKLLDFGVAKTTASTVKTRTGTLKGKVAYMSPEQARGAALDRRSDIFSLGIVLWEMVTTQRLFRADNDLATLQMIIHQPPASPRSLRPDCPPELERIILRALAAKPDDRYQTADQLVSELDELAREHKLKQSPSALAATLGQLFGAELSAWRDARARGVNLADHLHDINELTTPVSESDFISEHAAPDDDDDDLDELYDDDDADDEDLTEHQAPIVDALPPLSGDRESGPDLSAQIDVDTVMLRPISGSGVRPTPSKPFSKVAGTSAGVRATPSKPLPRQTPASMPAPIAPLAAGTASGISGEIPAVVPPADVLAATPASLGASPELPVPPMPPVLPPRVAPSAASLLPLRVDDLEHQDTVDAGVAFPDGDTDLAPPPSAPPPLPAPFAVVPPWHTGQALPPVAGAPLAERSARSWQVVALPPFDPETFERRRRLVLRVAGGVVAFIVLLAIIAGHC